MLGNIKAWAEKHKYKLMAGAAVLGVGCYAYSLLTEESEIKFSHFLEALKHDHVEEVVVRGSYVEFKSGDSEWFRSLIGRFPTDQLYSLIAAKRVPLEIREEAVSAELLNVGIASLFSLVTIKFMMQELQKPEISNSSIEPRVVGGQQRFEDYYGGEAIKAKLREIIDFLRHPLKYEKMGARIRRGVLFHGPPGTGKTMLARALASEAGCEFIKVVASEFQEMFVGVGAKRVRELFAAARGCANGCIVFVDEIDALGSRLNHLRDSHETTSTINQFLSEMDGFSPTDRIVIVAATNRIDLVDSAVLRAGRFDIKVLIPLPTAAERKGILLKLLESKCRRWAVGEGAAEEVGARSEGWCGADLENLVNEAIYKAIRERSEEVGERHVLGALGELRGR